MRRFHGGHHTVGFATGVDSYATSQIFPGIVAEEQGSVGLIESTPSP